MPEVQLTDRQYVVLDHALSEIKRKVMEGTISFQLIIEELQRVAAPRSKMTHEVESSKAIVRTKDECGAHSGQRMIELLDFAFLFTARSWFDVSVGLLESARFAALLFAAYRHAINGEAMSKTDVMRAIGAGHMTTAHSYLAHAEAIGVITITQSEKDKRVRLVTLTARGKSMVETELARLVADFDRFR